MRPLPLQGIRAGGLESSASNYTYLGVQQASLGVKDWSDLELELNRLKGLDLPVDSEGH